MNWVRIFETKNSDAATKRFGHQCGKHTAGKWVSQYKTSKDFIQEKIVIYEPQVHTKYVFYVHKAGIFEVMIGD